MCGDVVAMMRDAKQGQSMHVTQLPPMRCVECCPAHVHPFESFDECGGMAAAATHWWRRRRQRRRRRRRRRQVMGNGSSRELDFSDFGFGLRIRLLDFRARSELTFGLSDSDLVRIDFWTFVVSPGWDFSDLSPSSN